MDIQMPIMNGYEATIEIRKLKLGASVPIIAITAGTGAEMTSVLRQG
jgi:CheY-like chemotaxis protein